MTTTGLMATAVLAFAVLSTVSARPETGAAQVDISERADSMDDVMLEDELPGIAIMRRSYASIPLADEATELQRKGKCKRTGQRCNSSYDCCRGLSCHKYNHMGDFLGTQMCVSTFRTPGPESG